MYWFIYINIHSYFFNWKALACKLWSTFVTIFKCFIINRYLIFNWFLRMISTCFSLSIFSFKHWFCPRWLRIQRWIDIHVLILFLSEYERSYWSIASSFSWLCFNLIFDEFFKKVIRLFEFLKHFDLWIFIIRITAIQYNLCNYFSTYFQYVFATQSKSNNLCTCI